MEMVAPPFFRRAGRTFYTTDFPISESLISQSDQWQHHGLDWTTIGTSPGLAYGTQTGFSGNGGFDDSYAYLQGFGPNQYGSGVIKKDPNLSGCCHEFAIYLRRRDSAHSAVGYECGIAYNGQYGGITRWNGAYGDFTSPAAWQVNGGGTLPITPATGDLLEAQIVGNIITMKLAGTVLITADISTAGSGPIWTEGNPGMGLFHRNAASTVHGFTKFTAKTL
jgi:hypothetical protein